MKFAECPTCGWKWNKPFGPMSRNIPWGDCACTDVVTCWAHQVDPCDMPDRPPEAELLLRATERYQRDLAAWEEKVRKFEAINKLPGGSNSGT